MTTYPIKCSEDVAGSPSVILWYICALGNDTQTCWNLTINFVSTLANVSACNKRTHRKG